MKEVDARGLSCPEPLMLTAAALKGANEAVKVLVTEPHQKMNVEKYAKSHHGKKTTSSADSLSSLNKVRWIKISSNISYNSRCNGNGEGL